MAWAVGLTFATFFRLDLTLSRSDLDSLAVVIPIATATQLSVGLLSGLYRGRWRFGSFEEVAALGRAAGFATVIVLGVDAWSNPHIIPFGSAVLGGMGAFVFMGATRYSTRLVLERLRRPPPDGGERLLVFGAGDAAEQVLTAMLRYPSSPYIPVALLDDDRSKRSLRIRGVRVVGTRKDIPYAARRYGAETLLIAIPSAGHELISELADLASGASLKVKVLPTVVELMGGVSLRDIRPITEADILGRHKIAIDVESIAGYLNNRRVLVTGAGGSIGSELCRQISRFGPAELIMLDRDESALHGVELSIHGRALLSSPDLVLLDVRDREAVERVIEQRRPEVVFHAAALKHLPLLERYPREAVRTNVGATLSLLEVCLACGVDRFVNVSTDKAADPASVLGYSKRICERLTAHFGRLAAGTYLSVRFGNVLGSRGSMLPTFQAQIEAGGPVTVTHPEVTRFFMTVEEAVGLVIQAGAVGSGGETLVLDMGEPVRIAKVAESLISQAERPIEIVFTGLRPGEKLNETLFGEGETDNRRVHPWISHVCVAPLDPCEIQRLDPSAPAEDLRSALREVALQG